MTHMTRRAMLAFSSTALVSSSFLAGCTTTKTGHNTVIVLNVVKVSSYLQAGINGINLATDILNLFPSLKSYAVVLNTTKDFLEASLISFKTNFGDQLTVNYNDTNVKTLIDSILSVFQKLVDTLGNVVIDMLQASSGASNNTIFNMRVIQDSLSTILAIFRALLNPFLASTDGIATALPPQMTKREYSALKTLGVYSV